MSLIDRSGPFSGRLWPLLTVVCLVSATFVCFVPPSWAGEESPVVPEQEWTSLLDGKTLGEWEVVEVFDFKRHGKVHIEDGAVILSAGSPATGIRYKGDFPKSGYEISLEARRVEGSDFFCGVTFPVHDEALTLFCCGWSGMVFGLSNIDGEPAVENESCGYKEFEMGRWYRIRIRVTKPMVEVWIDQEKIIEVPTADRKFSLYWEMEPLQPLGICSWVTTGGLRNVRFRRVKEKPPAGAPFENAVSVWHMADARDSTGRTPRLVPSGNVDFGEKLQGIFRNSSLRRGGDAIVARCRGGRLTAERKTKVTTPNLSLDAMTVAIRLRDQSGRWNSSLLSKPVDDGRPVLNLSATDSGAGMELVLEMNTQTNGQGVRLTTRVAEIGSTGWHDLVARYDGAKVEFFVDGRVVDEKSLRGSLSLADSEPWLIGAALDKGPAAEKPASGGFFGLIDHAAVWDRALSDDAIELISGGKEEILQKKRLAEERRPKAKRERS
jgi:hypothetical protein